VIQDLEGSDDDGLIVRRRAGFTENFESCHAARVLPASASHPGASVEPAAPAAVLPPPANTLPANASPPPAAAPPKTHAEVYEALKKSDSFKAAAYLQRYMKQIYGPGHTPSAT
jgi:hypothetical protein